MREFIAILLTLSTILAFNEQVVLVQQSMDVQSEEKSQIGLASELRNEMKDAEQTESLFSEQSGETAVQAQRVEFYMNEFGQVVEEDSCSSSSSSSDDHPPCNPCYKVVLFPTFGVPMPSLQILQGSLTYSSGSGILNSLNNIKFFPNTIIYVHSADVVSAVLSNYPMTLNNATTLIFTAAASFIASGLPFMMLIGTLKIFKYFLITPECESTTKYIAYRNGKCELFGTKLLTASTFPIYPAMLIPEALPIFNDVFAVANRTCFVANLYIPASNSYIPTLFVKGMTQLVPRPMFDTALAACPLLCTFNA